MEYGIDLRVGSISGLDTDDARAAPAYANLLAAVPELWQARLRRARGVGIDK